MLAKDLRLCKSKEFAYVYNNGRIIKGKYIIIRFYQRLDQKTSRFGFAPARKIGCAVSRNRVKRRISEICRENLYDIRENYDIVVNIHRSALDAKHDDLKRDFLKVLDRAKLLRFTSQE